MDGQTKTIYWKTKERRKRDREFAFELWKEKKKEDGADDDQSFMDVLQRTRAITASLSLFFPFNRRHGNSRESQFAGKNIFKGVILKKKNLYGRREDGKGNGDGRMGEREK